jgi:hypothetical protein
MGQKIATEEDYWTCTQGIMPARMQSIQLTVKQKDGKRYLLKTDTATASAGDFVCKWMMLLMAAIAAIVAVAIVATGGAALAVIVAAGAIAGAAGAAVGTIAGGLVCGQKAALIRTWSEEKHNLVIAGQKTLTSASMMKCPVFGAEIKRAPNIKNWWQALLVGFGNFGTTVVEGALGGAMIGTVGALAAGAATLAAPTLGTVWANVAGSFTGIGLAVRGVFGANEASNEWASGSVNNMGEAAQSFGSGAVPEAGSLKRIATGQAQPSDALLLLYFLHLKTPVKEPAAPKEEEGQPKQEETNGPKPANEPEPVKEGEDGKAYEMGESARGVTKEEFFESVADFHNGKNPELAEEAWNLWKDQKWSALERLFNENELNGGWPPNRGFVHIEKVTLDEGFEFDRYGGRTNPDGIFEDNGAFIAERTTPFEDRALPESYKDGGKPLNDYKTVKPIDDVKKGPAIPWFGQKGLGTQFELPKGIDGLKNIDDPFITKE